MVLQTNTWLRGGIQFPEATARQTAPLAKKPNF